MWCTQQSAGAPFILGIVWISLKGDLLRLLITKDTWPPGKGCTDNLNSCYWAVFILVIHLDQTLETCFSSSWITVVESKARSQVTKTRSDASHLWYLGHFFKPSAQWDKRQVLIYSQGFRCDSSMRFLCLCHMVFLYARWNLKGSSDTKRVSCWWHDGDCLYTPAVEQLGNIPFKT